jgi:hypothetical protein
MYYTSFWVGCRQAIEFEHIAGVTVDEIETIVPEMSPGVRENRGGHRSIRTRSCRDTEKDLDRICRINRINKSNKIND